MKLDADQALTVGRAGSLANILVMTEEMLESARNDQWDDVTEMDFERRERAPCDGPRLTSHRHGRGYRGPLHKYAER